MTYLTENQKLKITRLGRGLTLEDLSRKLALSVSFLSLMERGRRSVPKEIDDILNFDDGVRWYENFMSALESSLDEGFLMNKDVEEIKGILDKILNLA